MYSSATRQEPLPTPALTNYAFGERLGAGSYGTVYKARLISNIQSRPSSAAVNRPSSARPTSGLPMFYAVKCIYRKNLTKVTEDLLINEIKLLKNIKHKNIVEMYDFQWDDNYIYIVMEYCAGGDLSMFIRSKRRLSERYARPFVKQIAEVLKFLYERNISHMDLKPENILLTSIEKPILKVADFGVAQCIDKQGGRSIRGTLVYMAPEILAGRGYDNRVDLWSVGVILYECLFGRPPFTFLTIQELVEKIQSNTPIEIPTDVNLSNDCQDLLEKLLQRDPNRRISFIEFFRHPFINNDYSKEIAHANEILQRATAYENAGDLKQALNYRVKAVDEYLAILKLDDDSNRQRLLRMEVQRGVTAAEDLKKRIKEASPNTAVASTPSSPLASSTVTVHDEFDLKDDNELVDAYQHCLNGNQLVKEFQFAKACEEYEIGLTVMFEKARSETDPKKVEILKNVISCYLSKAEASKQRNETQRIDMAIQKLKEEASNKVIMDESIGEDKKQNATIHYSCRQQ